MPAADHKAVAININGFSGSVFGQPSEDTAKTMALEQCQKRADAAQSPRKCEVYAVGNTMVYPHGKPPVPPLPWVKHDALTEKPFASKDVPLLRDPSKVRLENNYGPARKIKSIAIGPGGQMFFNTGLDSLEDSTRRNLQSCGALAGVACIIVAVDDAFVVPVPVTLKPLGFFRASGSAVITPDAREDVARRLAEASTGWSAVAVGSAGRPGLGLKAANEQAAVNEALGNCVKRDSDCHVIAIGPFEVGPN
jgi:adenylate cyclase